MTRGGGRVLWGGVAVATLLGVGATELMAEPSVDRGWPVPAAGFELRAGPNSGVVEAVTSTRGSRSVLTLDAIDSRGRGLWAASVARDCGNCEPVVPAGPRADGSYGPFGFSSLERLFAVSSSGVKKSAQAGGCTGLVLADATCIAIVPRPGGAGPAVRAKRDGVVMWEYVDPALTAAVPGLSDLDLLARDGEGRIFLGREGVGASSLLVALNASTGEVEWRQQPAIATGRLVGGLDQGVLIAGGDTLTAVDGKGARRWQRALPDLQRVSIDAAGLRVYVEHFVETVPRTKAAIVGVDLQTGRIVWTRATGFHRLLGTDPRGGVLVSTEAGSRFSLDEIAPSGARRWRWRTLAAVQGAVSALDGHVYATVSGLEGGAMLFRLDPSRPAARSTRVRARIVKRSLSCAGGCGVTTRRGSLLELSMPRATLVRWTLDTVPFKKPHIGRGVVTAPVGTSSVAIQVPRQFRSKEVALRLSWRQGGRTVTRVMPV